MRQMIYSPSRCLEFSRQGLKYSRVNKFGCWSIYSATLVLNCDICVHSYALGAAQLQSVVAVEETCVAFLL